MELKLDRCTVRSFRAGDAESIAEHANNRGVWINVRDRFPHPYTLKDAEAYLGRVMSTRPETSFAIDVGGAAIGAIGIEPGEGEYHGSAEIGYWLGEAYWGRGIATEVLRAMTEYAFSTFGLHRLEAIAFEWNAASARVIEKAGYQFEGRLRKSILKAGKPVDELVYAIVRE